MRNATDRTSWHLRVTFFEGSGDAEVGAAVVRAGEGGADAASELPDPIVVSGTGCGDSECLGGMRHVGKGYSTGTGGKEVRGGSKLLRVLWILSRNKL